MVMSFSLIVMCYVGAMWSSDSVCWSCVMWVVSVVLCVSVIYTCF